MASWGRIFLLMVASAALLAGCGSDDDGEIPPELAERMQTRLDEVQGAVERGDCAGEDSAEGSANLLREHIDELPADSEVHETLEAAATRLQELVAEECTPAIDEGASTEEAPVEPAVPEETDPVAPSPEDVPPDDEDEGDGDEGDNEGEDDPGDSGEGSGDEEAPENGPPGQGPDGEGPPGQGARKQPSGGAGAPRSA